MLTLHNASDIMKKLEIAIWFSVLDLNSDHLLSLFLLSGLAGHRLHISQAALI